MSAIVIIDLKNTPKLDNFIQDANNVFGSRGFTIISDEPRTYYNSKLVTASTLNSAVTMLKKSEFYNSCVKQLQYTQQFKK